MEYKKMKYNLDAILDNIILLQEEFGFTDEIDKLILMSTLVNYGYLSKDKKYTEDITKKDLELYQGAIFELGVIPITGSGCCRHTASLAKLILDRFDIKNEVTAALSMNNNTTDLLSQSEMIQQETFCNHALNIVNVNNKDLAINLLPNVGLLFYSIDNNIAVEFFDDANSKNNYLIYNYSPFFEGRKDFDKIKPLNVEEEEDILRSGRNTMLVINANIELLENFYKESNPYMEEVNNSYQKILRGSNRNGKY